MKAWIISLAVLVSVNAFAGGVPGEGTMLGIPGILVPEGAPTKQDLKDNLRATYPMAALALTVLGDDTAPNCAGLALVSQTLQTVPSAIVKYPNVLPEGVKLSKKIEGEIKEFDGYCNSKSDVFGDTDSAIAKMTDIKKDLTDLWFVVFPEEKPSKP